MGLTLVGAIAYWWYTEPDRTARQAASLIETDPARADALAEAAIAAGTSLDSQAWLTRCRAQLAMGKPLEALGAYAQIRDPKRCDAEAWCDLLERAQRSGDLVLTDMCASVALTLPSHRQRLLSLALPLKAGLLSATEESRLLDELRELAGDNAAAWSAIGRVERLRGHLAASVAAYERAVAGSAGATATGTGNRRELARLLIDLGQFDRAKPLVTELQQSTADDADDLLLAARLQHAEGDLSGAKLSLDRLLKNKPDHLAARLLQGSLLAEEQAWDEAITVFQECLRRQPHVPESHYRLGQAYVRKGDAVAAARHFSEQRRLAALQRDLLTAQQKRNAEPPTPELLDEIASIHRQLGDLNAAKEWNRAATALRRTNAAGK